VFKLVSTSSYAHCFISLLFLHFICAVLIHVYPKENLCSCCADFRYVGETKERRERGPDTIIG